MLDGRPARIDKHSFEGTPADQQTLSGLSGWLACASGYTLRPTAYYRLQQRSNTPVTEQAGESENETGDACTNSAPQQMEAIQLVFQCSAIP